MAVVRWQDWDGDGLEHCVFHQDGGGIVLEGVVAGTLNGHYGYFVRTDADFRTREVRVECVDGLQLHVQVDDEGLWHDVIGQGPLSGLEGCLNVDIAITPATNTLPIKRLKLREQEGLNPVVAYVLPRDQVEAEFLPRRAEQRYTCLAQDRRYRYEGLFRGFTAELEVYEVGLVLDYPGTFRRVLGSV